MKVENKKFYVYLHRFKNDTFYVGKGTGNRAFKGKRNSNWCKLCDQFGEPIRGIYKDNLLEKEAYKLEQKLAVSLLSKNIEICNKKVTGTGGTPHTAETKAKISEKHKGKKLTEEHKRKVSIGLTGKKQSAETKEKRFKNAKGNKYGLGYKHTEEELIKISNASKINRQKPVLQIDLESKEIICEFTGPIDAYRKLGINKGNISAVCRGERPQAGGYFWKYKGDNI